MSLSVFRYYFRDVDVDEGMLGAAPSDFFELLNLDLGASREEVRAAYRSIQVWDLKTSYRLCSQLSRQATDVTFITGVVPVSDGSMCSALCIRMW
jgi:hypothetical protein